MKSILKTGLVLLVFLLLINYTGYTQCTTLGQNPSTAFPVCGNTIFRQTTVPLCSSNKLFVPGCSGSGNADYENRNPFWYKFTCYQSGTLSFVITPLIFAEDYDWQLYDITGKNPDDVYTDRTIIVTGNWSGSYGATGATGNGLDFIQCASSPNENWPTFAKSPNLIAGHEYLLLISHFTDTQSGYDLSFAGGTAVITDPTEPHLASAKADCDGRKITVKLNKKMKCASLDGSEFSLSPAVATVTGVNAVNCSSSFDFDELVITLSAPLTNNNYQLIIGNGTGTNTLLDNCDRNIPVNEQVPFQYLTPQPIFADSIGRVGCAPDMLKVYFPKRINCASIAADGSDFAIIGPGAVTISGASGNNCINGLTDYIIVKLSSPISVKGNYQLRLKAGNDGTVVIDECGQQTPTQTLSFTAVDTVSATFSYSNDMDCKYDTLYFSHNGAHDVNSWNWKFNTTTSTSQNPVIVWPAASSNTAELIVSNGVCADTVKNTIILDNEVRASFDMPSIICPEDALKVTNASKGLIDQWQWNFAVSGTRAVKDPAPVAFPQTGIESFYTIKLVASNTSIQCSDSVSKIVRILNSCFIAVPTAFTPNGDGLNDFLFPYNALKAKDLEFSVYNRWGQLVFTTKDWQRKWDGKINGMPQPTGVYVWYLRYTHTDTGEKVLQKGTTTLIR